VDGPSATRKNDKALLLVRESMRQHVEEISRGTATGDSTKEIKDKLIRRLVKIMGEQEVKELLNEIQ
jgi:hypothetical protein